MLQFPRLKSGASVQYPTGWLPERPVRTAKFVDGTEQRFSGRKRRMLWKLRFSNIDDAEAANLRALIRQHVETQEPFSFTDPFSGVVFPKCELHKMQFRTVTRGRGRLEVYLEIAEAVE